MAPFPTRILYCGPAESDLRLHIPGSNEQALLLLGSQEPLWTLLANLREHTTKLRFDLVPETLADAISVARKLGIKYLWIDSLRGIHYSRSTTRLGQGGGFYGKRV